MFPFHRGLYAPRSTMHQFAKPGYMNFSPFPDNNIDPNQSFHSNKSPGLQSSSSSSIPNDFFDIDVTTPKESNSVQTPYIKKPQSKAERRAEHNAIERARRETLNSKFQMLAQVLPNLNNYRRPSKNQIIEKAFEWIKQSLYREEHYKYQIIQLQNENGRLLAQLVPMQSMNNDMISPPMSTQNLMVPPSIHPYTNTNTNTTPLTSYDNGWSNHSNHLLSPFGNNTNDNTLEIPNQDFGARSDEEDNISSANEDDIDYQSSISKTSFVEQGTSNLQHNRLQERHHQQIASGYSDIQAHYNSNDLNASYWNQPQQQIYNPLLTPPNNN